MHKKKQNLTQNQSLNEEKVNNDNKTADFIMASNSKNQLQYSSKHINSSSMMDLGSNSNLHIIG